MKIEEDILKNILQSLKGLRFGEVILKIQDSRIVQIERLEKFRVSKADSVMGEAGNNFCSKTNQIAGGEGNA